VNRFGVTVPVGDVPLSQHRDVVRELVDLGFTDLWSLETQAFDALTPLAAAAVWAPELRIGSAIASVFTRGPALLAMEACALAELAPGRFVLGIGSSSETVVSGWNGLDYRKPVTRVRETLQFLRAALAGERVDEDYETFRCQGFELERPPAEPPALFVGALRERMLSLSGAEADGTILGLLTAEDVPRVRRVVQAAGGEGELVLRLGIIATADREKALAFGRRQIAAYLNVPAYAAFHDWLGRGEELLPMWKAWREGDRNAAVAAVPGDLVDRLFIHGSPEACRDQIQAFMDAGVTTPVLSPMAFCENPLSVLRELSPAARSYAAAPASAS
jgi:probable F420-dependent oxidoreductase